ncbi:ferredoxin reductase family protein [Pelagibius litoralis]|uniref:Ferredoxin reductase family protein n=1 Tax=Pelagibius litoralis TaxID=374515 RepID=A0A967C204_9PROT|nr:ferredoxin reductase family protein [Pelagibius litoralis]NIA68401.1 ferredoxin reductase family protein [Pelagibius litoralis]
MRGDRKEPILYRIHPLWLLTGYISVALAPLALAYAQGIEPRGFRDELSSALAMVAFAMLLMEFVLSGRFRAVSGRVGIDLTMRFHQLIARSLVVFILIHPFLYATPLKHTLPWDPSGQYALGLDAASVATGVVAWILLAILILLAIGRDKLPYRYETWRLSHGLGAAAIAIAGAHHAIEAGRYSGHPTLETFWLVMVAIALLTLLVVYLVTPFRQLRHRYRVVSVEQAALKTWTVVIEPLRGQAIDFQAGQFVWLTLGRQPFAITEHPFSISSCPADRPRLGFTIKEVGDFTDTIGALPLGTSAYVDGPHGNLTLSGRTAAGLILIAGGVGIAPIMSILRQLHAERDPRPMKLVYGNRLAEQILYRAELDDLAKRLRLDVHLVLSEPPNLWDGPRGQLDGPVLAQLLDIENAADWLYVVCGPAAMIDSVEETLEKLGVPMRQIVSEKFSYD